MNNIFLLTLCILMAINTITLAASINTIKETMKALNESIEAITLAKSHYALGFVHGKMAANKKKEGEANDAD